MLCLVVVLVLVVALRLIRLLCGVIVWGMRGGRLCRWAGLTGRFRCGR